MNRSTDPTTRSFTVSFPRSKRLRNFGYSSTDALVQELRGGLSDQVHVDIRTVQELLGHKTLEMTMRYSHLASAHKAAAVEKLAASLERSAEAAAARSAASGAASPRPTGRGTRPDLERSWNVFSGRAARPREEDVEDER